MVLKIIKSILKIMEVNWNNSYEFNKQPNVTVTFKHLRNLTTVFLHNLSIDNFTMTSYSLQLLINFRVPQNHIT